MISWRFSGFLLGLSWVASACLPLATQAGTFKRITIDGSFTDWAGVPALVDDGVDSAANVVDYGKVYVANDDDYLYVRFTTSKIVNPFTSHENIFIDTDNDSSTGYQTHVGSELLIQGGTGYQEKSGVFNAGTIEGLDWKAMPTDNAADFEIRISRRAKYSSDGLPVFVGDMIQLVLEAETASFAAGEFAPGIGGAQYEFAAAPPVAHGTTSLVALTATEWLYDDSGSVPMTTWREVDFDGTAWKTGTGLFGYTSQPAAYPVPIKTALTKDRTAYYFRTVFPWTNDSRGLALVASNYVSDGAVFYLNGAAVSRLRLGTGTVTNGSTATGSAQPVGALSVLAIPPVALVEGTNVLAVEVHVDLGTPADLVFGLSLIASDQVAPQITDSTQPTNRTVIEGMSTTFNVPFLGAERLFFQWYKGSVAILDATNATFTLGPVTAEDAGNYQIKISNALASGITSRFAVLKTKALPAKIADATLPTDLTVVQGREARFTVTADGSPPFNYQWLKDGAPIVGATNATFILPAARVTDAGQYAVQVGNRLVDRANSRAATLIVQRDLTGPTITSVQGGPNEVIINFSEPVDPVTARAVSNYLVNPGVTIQKAIVEAITPQTVRLETLGQILGQAYHVTVSKIEDLFKNAISPASKVTFRSTILIDGSFDDWAGVPIAISDPADTMTHSKFSASAFARA